MRVSIYIASRVRDAPVEPCINAFLSFFHLQRTCLTWHAENDYICIEQGDVVDADIGTLSGRLLLIATNGF